VLAPRELDLLHNVNEQFREQVLRGRDRDGARLRGAHADVGSKDRRLELENGWHRQLPQLLANLRVPLRSDDENSLREALQEVGNSKRSKRAATVAHDYGDGVR